MTILSETTHLKLIKIVDTRDKIEVTGKNGRDRLVGIPGTGVTNQCPICGKDHEIHAYVEYPDGTQQVMGTGCAVKVDPSITVQMKKLELLLEVAIIDRLLPHKLRLEVSASKSRYSGMTDYDVILDDVNMGSKVIVTAHDYLEGYDFLPRTLYQNCTHYPEFKFFTTRSGYDKTKEWSKAFRVWARKAQRIALIPS